MSLQLSNIRVLNYKSIEDTHIEVKKIDESYTTVLVGLNETGKSNFLNAIGLINPPKTPVNYEDLKNTSLEDRKYVDTYFDFIYSDESEWKSIISDNIDIPNDLLSNLAFDKISLNVYLEKGKTSFITSYSTNFNILNEEILSNYSYIKLDSTSSEPEDNFKYEICLTSKIPSSTSQTIEYKTLSKNELDTILEDVFNEEYDKCNLNFSKWEAKPEYLITNTIDLNDFATDSTISYPLKNIFSLAGYKTQESISNKIAEINGNKTAIRRLETKLKNTLTDYVQKVWKESSVEFDITIQDTMQLDIFVIDKADPDNSFGMKDRSEGAKHILSLILSISVANETNMLKNNVIVIDEPEVHMHPSGIRYIREELLKIGQNNYVFIATHSQFMIDIKNKERHYIVTKPNNNTKIVQWDNTKDLADDEVLRIAFGLNVLNDLLAPYKVLVEGYSDCVIIKQALNALKKNNCINITNGLGSKIVSTASMLNYYNVPVFTIVDADNDGIDYKKRILNLGSPYSDDNVKTIKELDDNIISKGTIEDTLKSEYVIRQYKKALNEMIKVTGWDFEYANEKPILEELKIYIRRKYQDIDVEKLTENAKKIIAEDFKPNPTNLSSNHPKLKVICNKILEYFDLNN